MKIKEALTAMYKLQKPLISLLVVLLLTTSQVACTSTPLPPYEATYTTKLRGIKIKGVRKFEEVSEARYRISWRAKALWMRLHEWSEFTIVDGRVKPISYHYTRKGLGTDRPIHLSFDWNTLRASGSKGEASYEFDLVPGALDKLSYQVQMQIDLIANPKSTAFDYRVANYSRLSTYSFRYAGAEKINTNLGQRETLVFKRDKKNKQIKLWIAPRENYLPIKIEQLEDGDRNIVEIRNWVSESVAPATQLSSLSSDEEEPISVNPVLQETANSIEDDDF